MPDAEKLLDLALGLGRPVHRDRLDVDAVDVIVAGKPFHDRRIRHDDDVVPVEETAGFALGFQDAQDLERDLPDPDDLVDGIFVLEKGLLDLASEDANLGRFRGPGSSSKKVPDSISQFRISGYRLAVPWTGVFQFLFR